ncbi:hypothetical protein BJ875DRAFT_372504 [Amylocarpus encephaloides]|uniref:RING-type E3 ubiquitin transferase n=1 Tax=Amylocarpus encephaloides TaxID=45428 RepID=A0A9P7YMN0_9HELO|nr:hypothetical protein BJ875DRAFT_372504 [Amylocarpus encephaloides]
MASEGLDSSANGASRGDGPRGGGRGRGGRGRGRGRGGGGGDTRSPPQHRGQRGGDNGARGGMSSSPQKPPQMRSTNQKPTVVDEGQKLGDNKGGGEDEVEAEVCFICASDVVHNAVAPCNHRTCHICALRMRALYKTKDCAHCRSSAPFVIFTDDATKRYEGYDDGDIAAVDENIGIRYEKNEIMDDTILLLRYNCPDPTCDEACRGWPSLHRHVRNQHGKKICDLCSRHKKVFTHEHELYTDSELQRHMKKGDDNPGAVDQSGFKGHPLCGFCAERFYGEDELYVHCREKHERCFVCDRRGGRPQYYQNFVKLSEHFQADHFPCLDRECQEQKFVVFETEMDYKAHQLEVHGNSLSKDVRRDARVVDMASFEYRAPYVQERSRGGSQRDQREGRGRGRGRDPNAEPVPASTAQPLRRDEQAFQRQMAVQSAQSVTTRTFGGQLTAGPTPAQSRAPAAQEPPTITTPRPSSNVDTVIQGLADAELSSASTQDQARGLRHRVVIERASAMLQNDASKLNQFRNSISYFKTNAMTATALIDSFFALFSDTSSNSLGTLVREVADLYEDEGKSDSLRTAWNDWRAINEDYPSLPVTSNTSGSIPLGWAQKTNPGPSSSSSGQSSAAKSTRVLKLKSSTAQSSRSSVSQTRSWGDSQSPQTSASAPIASQSSNPFPTLPPPSGSASRTGKGTVTTVPWVPSSSTPSSSNPPSAPTSRPVSRGPPRKGPGSDAFPALPPAAKPQSSIFGYGSGMVRRDGGRGSAPSFRWGGGGSAEASGTEQSGAGDEAEEGIGRGKKKGNKGKKQVLLNWG